MKTDAIHTARFGEQAGIVLHCQWQEFCRLRTAVIGSRDTEAIHDLRVASRRLRATLTLFAPYLSAKTVKSVSKELRQVTRALGHLRNIDEAIIYFDRLSADLPVLEKKLRRARKREGKAVVKVLQSFPGREMARLLRRASARLGARSVDQALPVYLSDRSIQCYQTLYDLLAAATISENVAQRHQFRIAIKKWRYLLETLGQVSGQDYAATLAILKEYQTLLGSLNDMVEFGVLSAMLKLPPEETKEINAALARESANHFASFVRMVAQRPLQYVFHR